MALETTLRNIAAEYVPPKQNKEKEIAVACRFSDGKRIPYYIKYQDEYGSIQSADMLKILHNEKKICQGNTILEYCCKILIQSRQLDVVLIYKPVTCKWSMTF